MSERARLCAAIVLLTLAPSAATAQVDLARHREELAALRVRAAAAESVWRGLSRRPQVAVETLFVAELGVRVRIAPAGLARRDVEAVLAGMHSGAAGLQRRFGPSGRALVDTAEWRLSNAYLGMRGLGRPLYLVAGTGGSFLQWQLERPVRAADAASFLERRAAERLALRAPVITGYAGAGFGMSARDERLAELAREMSVSSAGVMRRCVRGTLIDCRRLLEVPEPSERLTHWYDPTEHWLAVNFSGSVIPAHDTVRRSIRRRCLDGADDDCTRLVAGLPIRPPYTNLVRFTFVEHALEVGQVSMVDSLIAGASEDPLDLLARSAGVPLDSLVAGWQRRIVSALAEDRKNPLPTLFATAAWSVAFFGLSIRRRRMR